MDHRYFLERLRNFYVRKRSLLFEKRIHGIKGPEAYISFSFDDFPRSAYVVGGAILTKYGIKGSYYASLGLMDKGSAVGKTFSVEDLQGVAADGHELGCHTYDHVDAWGARPARFEQSIRKNQEILTSLLGGLKFKTHSYPKRQPHPAVKKIAGTYFECCRGGGQAANVGSVDLNLVKSCFIDKINRENLRTLKKRIELNSLQRGWLVFSTHDVRNNPSRFGCEPELFEEVVKYAVGSGAVILPIYEAYLRICGGGR